MNSSEIAGLYKSTIDSTVIKIRNKIERPAVEFMTNFIDGPFLEIVGKVDDKFRVEFYDSQDKLVYSSVLGANMWAKASKKYFQNWKIKVNNDVIKFDPKGKRVFIAIDSRSLGDNIAWLPYAEEFRKKWGAEVIVSTFWNKLFRKSYKNLKFVEPGLRVNDIYAMYKIGWFYNEDMEPVLPNTIPLQMASSNILGLDFKEIKPEIDFKPKAKPHSGKYVVIAPHSTAGLKYWTESGWDYVIKALRGLGYSILNISLDNYNHPDIINIKNKSIESTMNYIHHSEFMIGLSSGLSWLSWAMGKHVVMISNFTEEDHEFTTNCTRIVNKSACNSCWNNPNFKFDKGDWYWCPVNKGTEKQFECHTSITGEKVMSRIKKLLK